MVAEAFIWLCFVVGLLVVGLVWQATEELYNYYRRKHHDRR